MRVLVTGAAGRIGGRIAQRLTEKGHDVRGIDIRPGAQMTGDLREYAVALEAMDGMEAVLHLGAVPNDHDGYEHDVLSSNAQGTWNILLACVKHGVSQATICSSVNGFGSFAVNRSAVYLPGDDAYPIQLNSPYQLAKHLIEETGAYFARRHAMRILAPRPTSVNWEEIYTHWRAESRRDLWGKVDLWGYVDLEDVCDALESCLLPGEKGFFPFLLAADDTSSRIPTLDLVKETFPDTPWRISPDEWLADNPYRGLIDTSGAFRAIGWRPQRSWRTSPPSPPAKASPS